eukprot:1144904-Pelagomonas_calceolata.AAC.1
MGSGKVSAMLNQWSSVKKSLQEEEEEQARREAEMQDPEVRTLTVLQKRGCSRLNVQASALAI